MSMDQRERDRSDPSRKRAGAMTIGLGAARIIALFMYVPTIPAFIVVASVVKLPSTAGLPAIIPWILFAAAVADYAVSLVIEGKCLGEERMTQFVQGAPGRNAETAAAIAAIIVAAFGVSIAVYGVVLGLLSFGVWQWYLYGLAIVHGIHQQLRWDRYEEAVRRARTQHID